MDAQVTTLVRDEIAQMYLAPEPEVMQSLVAEATAATQEVDREAVRLEAIDWVERCRKQSDKAGTLDAFLQEFGLSNQEGIALMCLAESLLRVPDAETADRLIAEKIHEGDWLSHRGKSRSGLVNASVWGLMLTGKIVSVDDDLAEEPASWMRRLVTRVGEPVVRGAVQQAMRIMGGQFVLGRDIREAIQRARKETHAGDRYAFDMLGEGARTMTDADGYEAAYAAAIEEIIRRRDDGDVFSADSISVKLSALHPRYQFSQRDRVFAELYPKLHKLALQARRGRIGLSIDAEECERLELSLDLFEKLARDPELEDWDGLGFVLQAYQKRSAAVARWLVALGEATERRLMVRLVKGAYWDAEIKRAQEKGLEDYPVFTRKTHSDVSYEMCARILLASPEAVYPQFATHNAYTIAMVRALADSEAHYEFQRLHGMGHLLYEEIMKLHPETRVRVYAPVGKHRDLLPYLVRRLLENGANSSFVNRFLDAKVPAEVLVEDPVEATFKSPEYRHAQIPVPRKLYRDQPLPWVNSQGRDLSHEPDAVAMLDRVRGVSAEQYDAAPIVAGQRHPGEAKPVFSPIDRDQAIGSVIEAQPGDIDAALDSARAAQPAWDRSGVAHRAEIIERVADLMEAELEEFVGLVALDAGRILEDGIDEVREAVDFCRYYAAQARALQGGVTELPGPTGEKNELSLHGRGVFVCISPWNFPLAIFTGQIVAALVTGNTVIAKPAEQTPLVADAAVRLMHRAGVPGDVLHLLPGEGASVGAALVNDLRVAGVVFTGGTDTGKAINRALAERPGPIVPLIAETGGLNVMIVDATALPEQVVDDVVNSAFRSAGQRCSALRVLYLQDDVADNILEMLSGAMAELRLGDPRVLSTDIGPVIDDEARSGIEQHEQRMRREAKLIARCDVGPELHQGSYVAPQVWEIESLSQLEREVFGPVLHVIRYRPSDIERVYDEINASGYGLTLGVHSRIDQFAREVFSATRVGNTYINRDMVGAVVGVNPFGGEGLSGTGPKAGGPHYLHRFISERTFTDNVVAKGGNATLFTLDD